MLIRRIGERSSTSICGRLPVGAITDAKSNESPLDANAPASRDGDRENLQDRRKLPIQVNKKPTIAVHEQWPTGLLHCKMIN
jgi:hypothetical protein